MDEDKKQQVRDSIDKAEGMILITRDADNTTNIIYDYPSGQAIADLEALKFKLLLRNHFSSAMTALKKECADDNPGT